MLRLRERRLRLRWEVRVPGTKVWLCAPADVEAEQKLRVDLQGPANQGGMIGARRNGEGAAHERRGRACKPVDGEHGILSVRGRRPTGPERAGAGAGGYLTFPHAAKIVQRKIARARAAPALAAGAFCLFRTSGTANASRQCQQPCHSRYKRKLCTIGKFASPQKLNHKTLS